MVRSLKIKINSSFICVLFLVFIFGSQSLFAQSRWIEDRAMNFKINVPTSYQTNQLVDGTDKVHAFVSPDQNLVVRVRAFKLNQTITDVQLQSIFEQNIIKGAVKLIDEASDLNGIPARWCGYTWLYNNVSTVLTNYYIVRPDYAYVVWSICAENMVDQKTLEMSNIMGSFTLINGHPQNNQVAQMQTQSGNSGMVQTTQNTPPSVPTTQQGINNAGNTNSISGSNQQQSDSTNYNSAKSSSSGIDVFAIGIGTGVDRDLKITNPTTAIPPTAKSIHAVFNYNGNAGGQNFQVKWFSITHDCLVIEDSFFPAINGKNQVHSSIENGGKAWPLGDYRTEMWLNDEKINGRNFSIGIPQKETVVKSNVLGQCYADGKGNNQTKSLGGKYYSLDLNAVSDNDFFEVRVTSGSLQFVTIHYRNPSGIWYTAYKGPNTKFRVGDVLNGKRNLYTHLNINVNAEHEKYLPVACYADIVLNPTGQTPPVTQQQVKTTNVNTASSSSGKITQIVLDNTNNTYDFDSGRICNAKDNPEPDLINEPWCTALPALCGNWAKTGKSRMEDVNSAPASGFISDGKSFVDCQECPVNEVLVFKNKEGRFGKLMIIKDENTKVNGNCQHRITCLVEYPAF